MNSFRLFLLVVAFAAQPAASAQTPSADSSSSFSAGLIAWRKGQTNEAIELLSKVSESDTNFVRAMMDLGLGLLAEGIREPARGLPFSERAYHKAPNDIEVVHAYIRCQLLARTNLSSPVTSRVLPKTIRDEFQFFTGAPKFADTSRKVTGAKLLADLDFLELILANVYSYADRRGVDWRSALDAFRASIGDGLPIDTFILRLRRFLTLFGDPHTAVRTTYRGAIPKGRAPFLPVPDGQRVLALKPDRSAFLDAECHYLAAIDGVGIAEWLKAAGYDVPKASPQFAWRATVNTLDQIDYLRTELGLPLTNRAAFSLVSAEGSKTNLLILAVTNAPNPRGEPGGESARKTRELDGGIGYLRIATMAADSRSLAQLDDAMAKFRNTRGLVIDVRGNGGGSQDTVKTILPYFLTSGGPMKIINVAAYRLPVKLSQQCTEGYLGMFGRGLYPVTSTNWTQAQRKQITTFLDGFVPGWKLPADRFSAWHVMAIGPGTNPKAYPYTNAVVVLTDAGCFSATDNFLGALKGQPNVTLLGSTSGGGSGRMTSYTLPNTSLGLTFCQMASFRANGDIFDGRGVAPDVVLEPKPEDHLANAGDSVLEAALKRLRSAK
jgi:hypothetical protein